MFDSQRSPCPIASSLDLIGDRWTLVLLRDMMLGKTTYSELLDSPECITTSVLAERLERMQKHGLIERQQYQDRPRRFRYLLTAKGRDLLPVAQALCRWGNRHLDDTWIPPERFMSANPADLPLAARD